MIPALTIILCFQLTGEIASRWLDLPLPGPVVGLVLLVVYPALLSIHGLNPLRFFAAAWPAIQLGFVTRSSVGTLPVTQERTEQALATGASLVVTACPYCLTMIDDGTKTKNVDETVKTRDIAEILWESVQ